MDSDVAARRQPVANHDMPPIASTDRGSRAADPSLGRPLSRGAPGHDPAARAPGGKPGGDVRRVDPPIPTGIPAPPPPVSLEELGEVAPDTGPRVRQDPRVEARQQAEAAEKARKRAEREQQQDKQRQEQEKKKKQQEEAKRRQEEAKKQREGAKAPAHVRLPNRARFGHAEAVALLRGAGINVRSSGGCADRSRSTCTSLEGIRRPVLEAVLRLRHDSACEVEISGGTEIGHAEGTYSHSNGYKIDILPHRCVSDYIESRNRFSGHRNDGAKTYRGSEGAVYYRESDHWDILVRR